MDERVSKGLAVCLSCGASLDAPPRVSLSGMPPMSGAMSGRSQGPPSAYGQNPYAVTPVYGSQPFTPHSMPAYAPPPPRAEPKKSSGAGTIIVVLLVVGAFAMMAVAAVAFFLLRAAPSTSSSTAVSTSTVTVETPETTDSTADTNPKEHPTGTGHTRPPVIPTVTSHSTGTSSAGLPPFPFSTATEKMDEATTFAERDCAFPSGPFGTTVIDVTFETDGRVGTLSRKPIGGTPTGTCITSKFLAIRVGAFEGSSRTFSRAVTITSPSSPASTGTGRRGRDGGR